MFPSSTVRLDSLPAVATVVAPGALATTPFAWLLLSGSDDLRAFLAAHEAVALAAAALVWIVMGFLVESMGSYVEVYAIDRRRDDHARLLETWWLYLRSAWEKEPVGQGYIRRLVVSFKFELNMFVGSLVAIFGFSLLGTFEPTARWPSVAAIILLGGAAVLLFTMARDTSSLLAETRKQLVRGVHRPPVEVPAREDR
jgi:hypothetical protein